MYALVFPGQGVRCKGMGAGLFEEFPELTGQADRLLGYSLADLCAHDPQQRLRDIRYAHPAIYFVNALLALRRTTGGEKRYLCYAGHGLGEYNALVAAGMLDVLTGLSLVVRRADLMARVRHGAMATVDGLPANRVERALRANGLHSVHVSGRNSNLQVSISGYRTQLRPAAMAMRVAGATQVEAIAATTGPYHTPLMAPAGQAYAQILRDVAFREGHTPVVSSVTGDVLDRRQAVELLARQLAAPVEWVRAVQTMRILGIRRFDEVNGRTLTSFIQHIG